MKSGERELLAKIIHSFAVFSGSAFKTPYPASIGVAEQDDCAAIDIGQDKYLVIGSDFVRGTGFKLFEKGIINYYDCGYYLIMANVSDIAAMAAEPIGIATVLRYSQDMSETDFEASLNGMRDAAVTCKCPIVGGDIGSYEKPVYSACAYGIVPKASIMRRTGMSAGDRICITKPVGLPATALAYFTDSNKSSMLLSSSEEDYLAASWKRPAAEVRAAEVIRENQFATSGMDISDGLKTSLLSLSEQNGLGFLIDEQGLPIDEITQKVSKSLKVDYLLLAAGASVDFSLLFSVNEQNMDSCKNAFADAGLPIWPIGVAMPFGYGIKIKRTNGVIEDMPGRIWDHKDDGVYQGDLPARVKNKIIIGIP